MIGSLVQLALSLFWLVVLVLVARRLARFLNTVEARAISIDEHLERLAKASVPATKKRPPAPSSPGSGDVAMSDRDRAMLAIAAERDRERAE